MSTDATAQSIARFWDRYIEQLNKHHVKPALQRWYVRHVECLISANANLRLAQYTPQTLEAYLQTLGRKTRDRHAILTKPHPNPTIPSTPCR